MYPQKIWFKYHLRVFQDSLGFFGVSDTHALYMVVISKVSYLGISHRQVGGPHAGWIRRWWWTSSNQWHIFISRISTKQHWLIHVLWRGSGGGGWRWWLQAALAAKAAAVAAEAVHICATCVVWGHASWLRVKRVLLVYVVIVPVPVCYEDKCSRNGAQHGAEGAGCQQWEKAQVE